MNDTQTTDPLTRAVAYAMVAGSLLVPAATAIAWVIGTIWR